MKLSKRNKFLSFLEYDLLTNFNLIIINLILGMVASVSLFFIVIASYLKDDILNDFILNTAIVEGSNNVIVFGCEIVLIILFAIFIWKREFDFEHKTSYRVLSLPIEKWKLIFSKCIVVEIFFLFYLAGQILGIILNWLIAKVVFINKIYVSVDILKFALLNRENTFFLPKDILTFALFILFVFAVSLMGALYTFMKKSYGVKGFVCWIFLSIAFAYGSFILPVIKMNLLVKHLILFELIGGITFVVLAFALNNYLLNKKVNV